MKEIIKQYLIESSSLKTETEFSDLAISFAQRHAKTGPEYSILYMKLMLEAKRSKKAA